MVRRRLFFAGLAVALSGLAPAGCRLVAGIDDVFLEASDASSPDAASDAVEASAVVDASDAAPGDVSAADATPDAVDAAVDADASPTFDPKALSNLALWVRADLGVSQAAGKVSSWADQSGQGRVLAQSMASAQPSYVAGDPGFGGKDTVSFDGVDDFLVTNIFAKVGPPFTVYLVAAVTGGTTLLDGINASNRGVLLDNYGPLTMFLQGGNYLSSGITAAGSGVHVMAAVFETSGRTSSFSVDQVTPQASSAAGSPGIDGVTLGSVYDHSAYGKSRIAEVILYGGAHDATLRRRVMEYLGARYGVSIGN